MGSKGAGGSKGVIFHFLILAIAKFFAATQYR